MAISSHGKCAVKEAPDAAFWSAFGGEDTCLGAPAPEERQATRPLQLSDSAGSLTCTEAKRGDIKVTDLDSNDVFILDAGREIFVWVGVGVGRGPTARRLTRTTSPSTASEQARKTM